MALPTYEKSYPFKEHADPLADQIEDTGDEELLDTYNEGTKIIFDQIMVQASHEYSKYSLSFAAVQDNWEESFAKLIGLNIKGTGSGWAELKDYENDKPSDKEDDPESIYDVLTDRILLYLGGHTGSATDRVTQEMRDVLDWEDEELFEDPDAVAKMDKLAEILDYRMSVRGTATMLVLEAGIDLPWGRTCAEWKHTGWIHFLHAPTTDEDKYEAIFRFVMQACFFSEPTDEQGAKWTPWPEYYIAAALFLADLTMDEVKQKVELMESMVNTTTLSIIENLKDIPIVTEAIRNLVGSMKKSGHTFTMNSTKAAKLGYLGFFDKDDENELWHLVSNRRTRKSAARKQAYL